MLKKLTLGKREKLLMTIVGAAVLFLFVFQLLIPKVTQLARLHIERQALKAGLKELQAKADQVRFVQQAIQGMLGVPLQVRHSISDLATHLTQQARQKGFQINALSIRSSQLTGEATSATIQLLIPFHTLVEYLQEFRQAGLNLTLSQVELTRTLEATSLLDAKLIFTNP